MHFHDVKTGVILKVSIFLMLALAVAEAVAGYLTHSLALWSDAAHNLTDSVALILAWFAFYLQSRPATNVKTYGYHRAGVLAAFVNALALLVVAGYIFYEAFERLRTPRPVDAGWMMLVAAIGFVIDTGVSLALLRRSHGDLNVRTAYIHTAADAASTAAIVVGAFFIKTTGLLQIDALLGFLIGGLILWSSVGILRESLNILLEGLPRSMRLESVVSAILQVEGVEAVHDVHVWSLGSNVHAMSGHAVIADLPPSESAEILRRINDVLERQFHISHTTIQFENSLCDAHGDCYTPGERIALRKSL